MATFYNNCTIKWEEEIRNVLFVFCVSSMQNCTYDRNLDKRTIQHPAKLKILERIESFVSK